MIRTPSLVSGSSASTFDSPRTNGLRRKPSTIEKYALAKRSATPAAEPDHITMRSIDEGYQDVVDDAIMGIAPPPPRLGRDGDGMTSSRARLAETLDVTDGRNQRLITPPIITGYAQTATPSTRYTDSPFSHAPTPSSASSYSPGIISTTNPTPLSKTASPVSRHLSASRRATKEDNIGASLAPVRESSQSSSSSTIQAKDARRTAATTKQTTRKPLPASSKASVAKQPPAPPQTTHEPSRRTSITSSKNAVQIPPELAHLNVEAPAGPDLQKPLPPIRPTRDGTPSLADLKDPSPIVQSDLPRLYTTYHKRTPSQDTPASAASNGSVPSPRTKSRFGFTRSSSKQPSPRIDSAISPPPSARNFIQRTATPDEEAKEKAKPLRKDSPAIATTISPSKSPRFGIFSRKPKTDVKVEKPKKEARRGPAAGTGHEGYGRFGIRGRSGSTASTSSVGRSPSADSSTSSLTRPGASRKASTSSKGGSELDDFLSERLNPIVLRGSGSMTGNETSSNVAARAGDQAAKVQLLPSAIPPNSRGKSPLKRPLGRFRRPSDSSEDDVSARYPSIAQRRSITRLNSNGGEAGLRGPSPIFTGRNSKQSSMDSYNADTSRPQTEDVTLTQPEEAQEGKEGFWLRPQQSEPAMKPPRKWNFFQRAHASPRKDKERVLESVQPQSGTSNTLSAAWNFAHYAMTDAVEPVDLDEVERMMLENATSPEASESESNGRSSLRSYERRRSSLLPVPQQDTMGHDSDFRARPTPPRIAIRQDSYEVNAPVRLQPHPALVPINSQYAAASSVIRDVPSSAAPQAPQDTVKSDITSDLAPKPISTPEMTQTSGNSPRLPRLSPVGRIPRVVSKRDRDRKLPDTSFSRPFVRTQPRPNVKPPGELYNRIRHSRELASPLDLGSQPVSSTSAGSGSHEQSSSVHTDQPSLSTQRTSVDAHHTSHPFMMFPQRHDSENSYSSSSGNLSWIASMMNAQPPQEEDVWNEYNDLLDEVMPQKTPISAGSSLGAPFPYSSMLYENGPTMFGQPIFADPQTIEYSEPPRSSTVPAVLSVPQQIHQFLQPSMSPITPNTIADFVATYQDRSSTASAMFTSYRQGLSQPSRSSLPNTRNSTTSSRNSRQSSHSRAASLPEASLRNSQHSLASKSSGRFGDTQLLDIAEEESAEKARNANLRFGALMASKWLSFGRVLFSPAHNEMQLADEPRVLIVDGLGSDWSYYVALSYPAAAVYNLRPSFVDPNSDSLPTSKWKPMKNHRHIRHDSISDPFPFPKGFFTAVVFRFPLASTDHAYHACISECKRVLRPGGHLEVAVLDLDLMNMGSKARTAVRGLKTRMQQHTPDVSLRNLSDTLVNFIGRRGFEEVQRCIVGVPAAGHIPRSQDFGSITSSDESGKKPLWKREEKAERTLSFSDLLDDTRNSRVGPMMSKVGRWWYTSCYETPLLPKDKSIWTDHALLRECEKQGTSFRLLICCAQKPTQTRRRTMSV
ncbi:hypothetical protein K431DRAFT_321934 [Polychaeton citri CBS 116435]|uniref:Methyltransferase type 11 domain-containing protein n=1 Tax=Polychaeton citri CBS 116435 TaxID=1314669 RepID=A0A9P4UKK5_9PEZI|nr:hypothetical protein K431DRAFT_321934 [Polychaeton citri CBS 116435]